MDLYWLNNHFWGKNTTQTKNKLRELCMVNFNAKKAIHWVSVVVAQVRTTLLVLDVTFISQHSKQLNKSSIWGCSIGDWKVHRIVTVISISYGFDFKWPLSYENDNYKMGRICTEGEFGIVQVQPDFLWQCFKILDGTYIHYNTLKINQQLIQWISLGPKRVRVVLSTNKVMAIVIRDA